MNRFRRQGEKKMRTKHIAAIFAFCLMIVVGVSACQKSGTNTETTTSDATTTETRAVEVARVDLGRGVGADNHITEQTEAFRPNETVYAAVITSGSAPSAEIKTRWTFQDGQVVDESTRTIAPTGDAVTEFHVSKPEGLPVGKYRVEVFLNGAPAATKEFEVRRT